MKIQLGLASAALAARVQRSDETLHEDGEKRLNQLTDMMKHYNPDFDERKYWAYGCNCHMFGQRPMSDPGHGPPVDALDAVCKTYKDCLKCARMKHGENCIAEFVKYRYGYWNNEAQCRDNVNTCDRALCECDAKLAKEHNGAKNVFNNQYHMFWSPNMWDPENACPTRNNGVHEPGCCGGGNLPYVLYNTVNKQCCDNGKVVLKNQSC